MKILFVTTRNIIGSGGETSLIKKRAATLANKWGIETEFYILLPEKAVLQNREAIDKGTLIQHCNLFILPFSYYKFIASVTQRLARDPNIGAVIISGTLLGFPLLNAISKYKNKVKIILDLHGAIEEFLEYPSDRFKPFGFNRLLYKICDHDMKKALSVADGTLVVSNSMKEHISTKYSPPEGFNFFIVPCGVCFDGIDTNCAIESRKNWRHALGIKEHEVVFVYSGGVSKWQNIKETIEFYNRVKQYLNAETRLMIMTNSKNSIREIISPEEQDVIIESFSPQQVQEVLYAGDIGMLLRDKCITNTVAFPNKFSEYMAAGLEIICSTALAEPSIIVSEYKTGYLYSDEEARMNEIIFWLNERITKRQNNLLALLNERSKIIGVISFNNTLVKFADWLQEPSL